MLAVTEPIRVNLPSTPYTMWERDELRDFLHIPHDRTKIEVIGGEIVVSPGPRGGHEYIAKSIERTFWRAGVANPAFPWEVSQLDLNLSTLEEGYVPDLTVLQADLAEAVWSDDDKYLVPDHAEMVVEVTSRSTAAFDRPPTKTRRVTKWSGYARVEIPYYLLIDRDPKAPLITLSSVPDQGTGAYLHSDTWKFGDAVRLEHFGIELDTTDWRPWKD